MDPRKMPLGKLFQKVFLDRQGYMSQALNTADKKLKRFNLLISKQDTFEDSTSPIGVIIKDWTRSIGVNSVIKAEHDAEEAGLNTVILVGNNFSLQARGMASRANIRLVSRGELIVNYPAELASY